MKFFVAISVALFASAHAIPAGIVNTGASAVSRSDDGLGNYAFGYNEDHATGGTFRKEKGGPGVQVGSYGLRDADGRIRTVNYVADALGFRASVDTNEPGVDPHQPAAATTLNGAAPVVPAVHAAPILEAHGPAPIALAAGPAYGPGPIGAYGPGPIGAAYGPGPLLAHGAPSAYSVATQHVSAGPLLAAGPGPLGYAGEGPLLAGKGLGLGLGAPLGAPLGLGLGYGAGKLGGY